MTARPGHVGAWLEGLAPSTSTVVGVSHGVHLVSCTCTATEGWAGCCCGWLLGSSSRGVGREQEGLQVAGVPKCEYLWGKKQVKYAGGPRQLYCPLGLQW